MSYFCQKLSYLEELPPSIDHPFPDKPQKKNFFWRFSVYSRCHFLIKKVWHLQILPSCQARLSHFNFDPAYFFLWFLKVGPHLQFKNKKKNELLLLGNNTTRIYISLAKILRKQNTLCLHIFSKCRCYLRQYQLLNSSKYRCDKTFIFFLAQTQTWKSPGYPVTNVTKLANCAIKTGKC